MAEAAASATTPRILVIEDNAEVRENMVDILRLAGYDAQPAAGGRAGVEQAVQLKPDLILCDVMMPELDGYGVLKILTERADTRAIPFVFVTAKSEQEDLRRGMNLGADDYVTKPFYKDELLRVVEIRLRKHRARAGPRPGQQQVDHNWTGFLSRDRVGAAVESLVEGASTRRFKRGEAIYRTGENVRDVFFVREGFAKHLNATDFGKSLIVYVFRAGEFFGYPELIAQRPYEHDTIALTDLELAIVPGEVLRKRLAADAHFADLVLGLLSTGLLEADRRMLNQAYLSVRKRCAETILRARDVFGDEQWPMSREELSQWAGTAKETFIRNLTDFRDEGLVEVDGTRITVADADALAGIPG